MLPLGDFGVVISLYFVFVFWEGFNGSVLDGEGDFCGVKRNLFHPVCVGVVSFVGFLVGGGIDDQVVA